MGILTNWKKREQKHEVKKKNQEWLIFDSSPGKEFVQTFGMFYSWILFSFPTKLKVVTRWFWCDFIKCETEAQNLTDVFLLKQ